MEAASITEVLENFQAKLDYLESLIGDTPASTQINVAIENHTHDNFVTLEEYNALAKEVERLIELVGDATVSEQINVALKSISK